MSFNEQMQYYTSLIESMLPVMLQQAEAPDLLAESMEYSLMCGGKRLRPALCMAACNLFGGGASEALKAACSLEMIHTYSLIHDDLPAMDNDDYRRGKPSNHKVYGEANAILAGDGLLSLAFVVAAQTGSQKVMQIISRAALDMVSGQSMDINGNIDGSKLFEMHQKKTGALIKASVLSGAYSSGNDTVGKYAGALKEFSEKYGLLFQITDDILDVIGTADQLGKTTGKDAEEHKTTFVTLYGLEPAKAEAELAAESALAALKELPMDTGFFEELVRYTLHRRK